VLHAGSAVDVTDAGGSGAGIVMTGGQGSGIGGAAFAQAGTVSVVSGHSGGGVAVALFRLVPRLHLLPAAVQWLFRVEHPLMAPVLRHCTLVAARMVTPVGFVAVLGLRIQQPVAPC
jgi:hypothetical protein